MNRVTTLDKHPLKNTGVIQVGRVYSFPHNQIGLGVVVEKGPERALVVRLNNTYLVPSRLPPELCSFCYSLLNAEGFEHTSSLSETQQRAYLQITQKAIKKCRKKRIIWHQPLWNSNGEVIA
jgi:hypothetical protein